MCRPRAGEPGVERLRHRQIAGDDLDIRRQAGRFRAAREHAHGQSSGEQLVDDLSADPAGAADDENAAHSWGIFSTSGGVSGDWVLIGGLRTESTTVAGARISCPVPSSRKDARPCRVPELGDSARRRPEGDHQRNPGRCPGLKEGSPLGLKPKRRRRFRAEVPAFLRPGQRPGGGRTGKRLVPEPCLGQADLYSPLSFPVRPRRRNVQPPRVKVPPRRRSASEPETHAPPPRRNPATVSLVREVAAVLERARQEG